MITMTGPGDSVVNNPWSEVDPEIAGVLADAVWIGPHESVTAPPGRRPVHLLRRRFTQRPRSGHSNHLMITAHGIAEVFLNGFRVGDDELTPGFTAYRTGHASP